MILIKTCQYEYNPYSPSFGLERSPLLQLFLFRSLRPRSPWYLGRARARGSEDGKGHLKSSESACEDQEKESSLGLKLG